MRYLRVIAALVQKGARLLRQRKTGLVLVPYDFLGERDMVRGFARFVGVRHRRRFLVMTVDASYSHFDDLVRSVGASGKPERLILFAHPLENSLGFAVNATAETQTQALLLRWWEYPGQRYDMLFAFVCAGAKILRRRLWQNMFPRWVSFEETIRVFLASERGCQRWKSVFGDLLVESERRRSARELSVGVIGIFEQALRDLWDTYDEQGGDILNLMYFQACIDNIRWSEV